MRAAKPESGHIIDNHFTGHIRQYHGRQGSTERSGIIAPPVPRVWACYSAEYAHGMASAWQAYHQALVDGGLRLVSRKLNLEALIGTVALPVSTETPVSHKYAMTPGDYQAYTRASCLTFRVASNHAQKRDLPAMFRDVGNRIARKSY